VLLDLLATDRVVRSTDKYPFGINFMTDFRARIGYPGA
jgi:hypothetical protein